MAIWQDLVSAQGFAGSYQTVKRFVRKLRGPQRPEAAGEVARELGTNSILMINDYEQGRRLALYAPSGGIVSLKELPDAIRLVAESAKAQPS